MSDFMSERIEKLKEIIRAYDEAILALITEPTKTFTLNTSQNELKVQYQDLDRLVATKDTLLNQLLIYEKRNTDVVEIFQAGW